MKKSILLFSTLLMLAEPFSAAQAASLSVNSNSISQIGFIDNAGILVDQASSFYDFTANQDTSPLSAQVLTQYELSNPGVSAASTELVVPFYTTLSHYYASPFAVGCSRSDALSWELLSSDIYDSVNDTYQTLSGGELLSALQEAPPALSQDESGTLFRIFSDALPDSREAQTETALSVQNLTGGSRIYYLDHSGSYSENSRYSFRLQLSGEQNYAYIFVTGTEGTDYEIIRSENPSIHVDVSTMRLSSYLNACADWYLETLYPEMSPDSDLGLYPSLISYVNQYKDQSPSVNLNTALDWCMNQPLLLLSHMTLDLKPEETVQLQIQYPAVYPTVLLEDQTRKYRLLNGLISTWPDPASIRLSILLPDTLEISDDGSFTFSESQNGTQTAVVSGGSVRDSYFSLRPVRQRGAAGWICLAALGGIILILAGGALYFSFRHKRSSPPGSSSSQS